MIEAKILKLLYIFTSAGLKSDSVQKKVEAQIEAMNLSGISCKGVFFSTEVIEEQPYSKNITLIPVKKCEWKYFQHIGDKKILIQTVLNYIGRINISDYYLYIRYPGASFKLYKLARQYGNAIISEHQSKETEEILSTRVENPFGFKLSKLLGYFQYQLWPVYNEKIWGRLYAKTVRSIITVTGEIAAYQKRKGCDKVFVIPNGIKTNRYKVRTTSAISDTLNILFLKGTATQAPWNGLDRLIASIDAYKKQDIKIILFICGNIIEGEVPERDYIIQTGYLEDADLDKIFSKMHMGVSTLCLYRKGLNEAAVLKAREYFTRGLPYIYAYEDPDIEDSEEATKYTLKFSNNDSLIDMHDVFSFANRVSKDKDHPQRMNNFSQKNLDWKAKMIRLKEIILAQIEK